MQGAVEVLLRRAQNAGAVRPDVRVTDLFALLKGLIHAMGGSDDPDMAGRMLAVVRDGLRPSNVVAGDPPIV
jgi:hypothetical protein